MSAASPMLACELDAPMYEQVLRGGEDGLLLRAFALPGYRAWKLGN
jgi:hypothetical protein